MNTPLHCMLLMAPGEHLKTQEDFPGMGYAVELFAAVQDSSCLDDREAEDVLDAYAPGWRNYDLPATRSQRASLALMLADPRWKDDDCILFAESGAAPLIDAATLREVLEKELAAHPETHLFRLFHHKAHSAEDPRKVDDPCQFSPFLPGEGRSKESRYVSGLYAFIVPSAHRQRVADIFLHTPLPPDRALELGAARGSINIRVTKGNLFYQKRGERRAQVSPDDSLPKRPMAVCVAVRHLESLERLLPLFVAQPYRPCHIFAAVKGMTPDYFSAFVLPRYESWIKQGMVTLRHYPGKNRVSDLIDTVRGLDVSGYDLFVFPREELLCSPGLLERINRVHARLSPRHCSYERGMCRTLVTRNAVECLEPPRRPKAPLLYTLTREAMECLMDCEREPGRIARLYADRQDPKHGAYGQDADALMMQLVRRFGSWDLSDIERDGLIMVRAMPPGRRNNPLRETEEILHEAVTDDPAHAEYLVELEHPYWKDSFRILGLDGCRVAIADKATVLRFTQKELILQWEKWDREQFTREEEQGPYRLRHAAVTRSKPEKTQETSTLVEWVLAGPPVRWGVCAVALPRESYYWLRDWIEFHLRAGATMVVVYDNTGSTGSRRVDSVFQEGSLQREGRSKRGEDYGRLTAHLSDEQIHGELDGLAARYGRERVRIVPWQPRDPETGQIIHGQVEAYDDFIRRWGGELDWCAFIDVDEYLYCRAGGSIGRILEQVEEKEPDVSRLIMKAWKFRQRWEKDGPRDIRRDKEHLALHDGGEKNFVRVCDVKEADIHWYWNMKAGTRAITMDPCELAFCHYNASGEEMERGEVQSLIEPRAFLTAQKDGAATVAIK